MTDVVDADAIEVKNLSKFASFAASAHQQQQNSTRGAAIYCSFRGSRKKTVRIRTPADKSAGETQEEEEEMAADRQNANNHRQIKLQQLQQLQQQQQQQQRREQSSSSSSSLVDDVFRRRQYRVGLNLFNQASLAAF